MKPRRRASRPGRNDPCPCGSGEKFKRCCLGQAELPHVDLVRRQVSRSIAPNLVTMWTARDVFGAAMTWEEAQTVLRGINREIALLSMAMLNAVGGEFVANRAFPRGPEGRTRLLPLVNYLFAPADHQAAIDVWNQNSQDLFMPLSAQGCIAMSEACLRFCDPVGGASFEAPCDHPAFARVLLSFQDALVGESVRAHATNLDFRALSSEQFADFTRNYLSANFENDLPQLMRRFYMMFQMGAADGVTKTRAGLSPAEWFRHVAGFEFGLYGLMQLVAMHHGHRFDISAPNLLHLVYDLNATLANMVPSAAEAYRKLHELASVDPKLPDLNVPDWTAAVYHCNYLRLRPVIHVGGSRYLCLHRQLLVEKFFSGVVHVLTELAERHPPVGWATSAKNRRLRVRREMGYVFEDYGRLLVKTLFSANDVTIAFGVTRADGGECDALIIANGVALVFEFVHHPWSLAERARGAPDDFVGHLADNAHKAGKMCRDLLTNGYQDSSGVVSVTKALPIVLMSDMMPITEMTSITLQSKLAAQVEASFVTGAGMIAPAQTLSITQMENLDRLNAPEGATALVSFLEQRAATELDRFSGAPTFRGAHLGRDKRLRLFSEEAERAFHQLGPTLFSNGSRSDRSAG